MEISELDSERFKVGLELLRDGRSIVFNDVSFGLNPETKELEVAAYTTWKTKVTEQTASVDLQRGIDTFDFLIKTRSDFVRVIKGYPPRFSLIDDYGTGTMEICHLYDGKIVWI